MLRLNERYPGRFNNPSSDYPEGSFKNRTAPAAKDGSYLEQDWANDREGFFQSLLAAAGIEANGVVDKVGASQLFDALQKLKQSQSGTAFPTTGPSAALVLTPAPAISAYAAGLRFRVKFNRASTGADTINISAFGPKSLKQYDASGAKVAAVFAIDQLSDVEYDGTDFVLLDRLPVSAVQTRQSARGISRLIASANGTSSNIQFSIGEAVVVGGSGPSTVLAGINLTLNTAATASATVSGMVGGATVASTWYAVYAHYNPSSGVTILTGDANFSAPTAAPAAGFTQWCRVGSFRTDSTANKNPVRFTQKDSSWQYSPAAATNLLAAPLMGSGVAGVPGGASPTWVAVPVGPFIPPTANKIRVYANTYSAGVVVAPNNSYSGQSTTAVQGAPMILALPSGNAANVSQLGEFVLESANIYWASGGANGGLICIGFEDSL